MLINGTSYDAFKLIRTQPHGLISPGAVKNMIETILIRGPNAIEPIVVHVHKGKALIVDGHHRLQAFLSLGYARVPIKYIHENQLKNYGRTLADLFSGRMY